jgi:RNA polymerase sigma factor FliA
MPPGVVFQDLVSWGVEGLIKAKKKFDSTKGAQFKTYANFRIRGEILDKLRKEWSYRSPTAFKHYKDKIQDRITEVIEETLSDEDHADPDRKVNDLLSNTAIVYMLSLEDMTVSSAAEQVEDSSENFADDVEHEDEYSVLWDEIKDLDSEEQEIISMFYKQSMSQKEISETLKLSRSKVCRVHSKVLEKLRRRLSNRYET